MILASASPRRRQLLEMLGLDFQVMTSPFPEEEETKAHGSPSEMVTDLAKGKAEAIGRIAPEALVIAADTIVVAGDRLLGKPSDEDEAYEMLSLLSGRWHEVYTGLVLLHLQKEERVVSHEVTKVHFRNLTDAEIEAYIRTGEPGDKAGGYGIQGLGATLVDRIEGCFFNVMGLPLSLLSTALKGFGIDLLEVNSLVRSLDQKPFT